MKSRIGLLIVSALIAFLMGATAPASADDVQVTVKSDYPYKVHLKFYSQNYNRSWPGPTASTVWVLSDYETHTYNLSCATGEKICYGAWVAGDPTSYWGSGRGDKQPCSSCCITCGRGPYKTWVLKDDDDDDE